MGAGQDIARAMQKLFPDKCKVVKIEMLHADEVRKYVMRIEEGHKKAGESTLHFP